MTTAEDYREIWKRHSMQDRGIVLTGKKRHYCAEWDGLCIDETCPEWPCGCAAEDDSYDADKRLDEV